MEEQRFDTGEVALNYATLDHAALNDAAVTDARHLPPLVLLHRLTSRWQSWRAYLEPLSASWRIFALDLRGHGQSGWAQTGYRAVDYARDLTAFLRRRVDATAVLCGHSGGALAAMLAAAQAPERIKALLLSEPPLYLLHDPLQAEPSTFDWFNIVEEVRRAEMPVEAIAALLRARFPRVQADTAMDTAAAIAQVDPEVPRAALSGELAEGFDLDATLRAIRAIACPVIFLQGEKSLGGSLWDEDTQRIQTILPAAQIHKLTNTGHNTVDRVETVIELLNGLR